METLDYSTEKWAKKQCPPINCHKKQCKCGLEKVFLASALGDDSEGSPIAPKNGAYCNAVVVYEANGHIYIYTAEGIPVSIGIGEDGLDIIEKELATLQQEIDDLKNSPDVVDIVPTYAALQAYDTSKLGDNDIIRVLQDETHDGQSTYYRWNATTSSWTYIGAVGAYYTKDQIDALLSNKQNVLTAGSNITISGDTISATDTTYTAGTGLTLTDTTFAIDTDVVATKSDLPTVNDATLTINQNGVNKGTFTANDADNVTVNLTDTTYTAGNAINITSNVISADIYPADYFTAGATVTDTGSSVTLNKTIPAKLKSVELNGNTTQQTYSGKNLIDYLGQPYINNNATATVGTDSVTIQKNTDSLYAFAIFKLTAEQTNSILGKTISVSYYKSSSINGVRCGIRLYWIATGTSMSLGDSIYNGHTETTGEQSFSVGIPSTPPDNTKPLVGILFYPDLTNTNVSDSSIMTISDFQIEIGSSPTTYEPYVGGIPAPNPDYPQDIHVVTGEQTVTVRGKNLASLQTSATKTVGGLSFTTDDGYIHINGTVSSTDNFYFDTFRTTSGSAVFSAEVTGYTNKPSSNCAIVLQSSPDGTSNWTSASTIWLTSTEPKSQSVTLDNTKYYRIRILATDTSVFTNATIKPQLELGSTATPFQPYQSQSYTVDLGSTELCKIGNYQDYIYKSGDDWYVHKALGKSELGDLTWLAGGTSTTGVYRMYTDGLEGLYVAPPDNNTAGVGLCSHYLITANNTAQGSYGSHITLNFTKNGDTIFAFHPDYTASNSGAGFKTWLTDNSVVLYYALATPTDTKITDATLIGQLDALANANSYLDATSFVVTATGTNLPAILDVSAYRNSAKGVALRPDIVGEDQAMVELTADMYNWNSSSQTATEPYDSIALWLLDVGAYEYTDINIPVYKASHIQLSATGLVWVTPPQAGTGFIGVISLSTDSSEITYSFDLASDGTLFSQYVYTDRDSMLASVKLNIVNIQTSAAPTTSDSGVIGQLWVYVDGNSDPHLYICTEIDTGVEPTEYIWEELQSGGGGGPTVVQTTGTSTTDVMSQDATTKLVYPDIANMSGSILIGTGTMSSDKNLSINSNIQVNTIRHDCIAISGSPDSPATITNANAGGSIAIGGGAYCGTGGYCVAIGNGTNATGGGGSSQNVAIGYYASTNSRYNAVAVGSEALCTRDGEVNIGTGYSSHGYNSTPYRVLGGVHDGVNAHDAMTVGQANALIDAINTALSTNIPHIGA